MPNLSLAPRVSSHSARPSSVIAVSAAMRVLIDLAERVAPTNLSVLLQGETGTGKDVLARHIHEQSGRSGAFVPVNCAALPTTLADSELFGHVRGAFTGAERQRDGVFEQAHGGTLFLDEIGDLDLVVQGKLLRVIEDGMVLRLGSSTPLSVDVRIIAATHRDLRAAVEAGRFREDLYQRLDGITLFAPPLRERPEDIKPLAERFLTDELRGGASRVISAETIAWLEQQPWRGNARELKQAVRRAVALGGNELRPVDFGLAPPPRMVAEPTAVGGGLTDDKSWTEIERDVIAHSLRRHGSVRAAARALGRPKSTLHDRIRVYGLAAHSPVLA